MLTWLGACWVSKETKIAQAFERTYFDLVILALGMLYSNAPIRIYPNTNIWYTSLTPLSTTSFHPARPLVSAIKVIRNVLTGKRFRQMLHGTLSCMA